MMKEEENEPKPLRIIGIPIRKNGKYVLNEFAILGRECGWICPRCNNEVRIKPDKAGNQTFSCEKCNASFQVFVDPEADTFLRRKTPKPPRDEQVQALKQEEMPPQKGLAADAPEKKASPAAGILLVAPPKSADAPQPADKPMKVSPAVADEDDNETKMVTPEKGQAAAGGYSPGLLQWGGFFSRKRHPLRQGANIIGRRDQKTPSDLEFDDPEMSRRSVKIDAIPSNAGGFSFTLTVLKSLNPVTVNGKVVAQGQSVRLNNNDTLTMGKTSLTFKDTSK